MDIKEHIIVGSGCCGAIAAKTLIDAGVKVTLLDVGYENTANFESKMAFQEYRKSEENQSKILLGKNFESLAHLLKDKPIHLTPYRNFVVERVSELLPWIENSFWPTESLAKGGLGNAWGLGTYQYSQNELNACGLSTFDVKKGYQYVSKTIGIAGDNSNIENYGISDEIKIQKPIPLDFNGNRLFNNYTSKKTKLKQKGFTLERTPLAISTEDEKNGEKYKADDWDFYNSQPSSGYRPIYTISQLEKHPNFEYINNQLVLQFEDYQNYIEIQTKNTITNQIEKHFCKKVLFCSGTIGTAKIVMRSLEINKLPVICNPYHNIPSIQLNLIGAQNNQYQTGLSQLSLYYDKDNSHSQVAMGSIYSYRSLMGFRLLNEFPLDYKTGLQILKLLQPALNVTGLFYPEHGSETKYFERVKEKNSFTNDVFKGTYKLTEHEIKRINETEKAYKKALFTLGTVPLTTKKLHHGASIHYGGTLQFIKKNKEGFVCENGSLKNHKNIFISDGSGFSFLSGKGLTFTLMAYAHAVALNALKNELV
jgi:hypothetical protein